MKNCCLRLSAQVSFMIGGFRADVAGAGVSAAGLHQLNLTVSFRTEIPSSSPLLEDFRARAAFSIPVHQ